MWLYRTSVILDIRYPTGFKIQYPNKYISKSEIIGQIYNLDIRLFWILDGYLNVVIYSVSSLAQDIWWPDIWQGKAKHHKDGRLSLATPRDEGVEEAALDGIVVTQEDGVQLGEDDH